MFNVLTHFFEKLTSLRAKWDQDLSIEVRTMCGLRLKMSENRDAKFVKKLVAKKKPIQKTINGPRSNL